MGDYNRLVLYFDIIAVLASKHVDFPLVHAELADVRLEEKDVTTLHAGVEALGHSQVILLP